jgi:hypothetical protein
MTDFVGIVSTSDSRVGVSVSLAGAWRSSDGDASIARVPIAQAGVGEIEQPGRLSRNHREIELKLPNWHYYLVLRNAP